MNIKNIFKKQPKQQQAYVDIKYSKLDHIGKVQRIPIVQKEQLDNINNQIANFQSNLNTVQQDLNNVKTQSDRNKKYIKQYVFLTNQTGYSGFGELNVRKISEDFFGIEFNPNYDSRIWSWRFGSNKFKATYYFYQLYIRGFKWQYGGVFKTWYVHPILIKQGETRVSGGSTPETDWITIFDTNKQAEIPRNILGIFNKNFVEVDNINRIEYVSPIIEVVFWGKDYSDY